MIRKTFLAIIVCAMLVESSLVINKRSRRDAETCGISTAQTELIIGGEDFARGTFPWIVALLHTGWSPPRFFCGGSLISKTFVITAAHCILKKSAERPFLRREILAIFGAHNLSNPYEHGRFQLSPKKIFIHPEWSHQDPSFDADISLLEFWPNRIHFEDYIQPICLWNSDTDPTVTDGTVTGWGQSEKSGRSNEITPKIISAPIQTNDKCLPQNGRIADISSERTFCAGLRNGSGVCRGDSGGGLFIKVDEVYYLRGIVSSSLIKDGGGCDVWKNAVYTDVLKFKKWIKEVTEGLLEVAATTPGGFFTTSVAASSNSEVFCTVKLIGSLETCIIDQAIETNNYKLGKVTMRHNIKRLDILSKKEVKFLPRYIGNKFPNLMFYLAENCELDVVLDFYFKDMTNLKFLNLNNNKIETIESDAFRDLISLEYLFLSYNKIRTLDEKLFVSMVSLTFLQLDNNELRFVTKQTFEVSGGKLKRVDLEGNECVHEITLLDESNWDRLETDSLADCSKILS